MYKWVFLAGLKPKANAGLCSRANLRVHYAVL